MDELDLYKDLDEFYQQEDKKSKELLAWEQKYEEAIKTNEELLEENNQLRKNIKMIEVNFQSLLDTARAELRRKQREIDTLREKYDDVCFRRIVPKSVQFERQQQQQDQLEQPEQVNAKQQLDNTDKSFSKSVREKQYHSHSSRESSQILTNVELRKTLYGSTAISDCNKIEGEHSRYGKERTIGGSNHSHNNSPHGKYQRKFKRQFDSFSRSRSPSRSRSHSRSRSRSIVEKCRKRDSNKRNRSRSSSKEMSAKTYRAHKYSRQSPNRNTSSNAKGKDNFYKHKESDRNENCKTDSSITQKSAEHKKSQDGIITCKEESSNNTRKRSSPTIKLFNQHQQIINCSALINNSKHERKRFEIEYKVGQGANKEKIFKKEVLDVDFASTLNTNCVNTVNVAKAAANLKLANSHMTEKASAIGNGKHNGNGSGCTNTKVRYKLPEPTFKDVDMDKYMGIIEIKKNPKNMQTIQGNAKSLYENVLANYTTCNPINKLKQVDLLKHFPNTAIGGIHDSNVNTNLESNLIKRTDQMESNALMTSNSKAKINETLFKLIEQDFNMNNMHTMQKKNLNENFCKKLKPSKIYNNSEKKVPCAVYTKDVPQNLSKNEMDGNEVVLPKNNINMNIQPEEKIKETVHLGIKSQTEYYINTNIQQKQKVNSSVHSAEKLQPNYNVNTNVQQGEKTIEAPKNIVNMNDRQDEKIIEVVCPTNKLQPKNTAYMNVQQKEKTVVAVHAANILQPEVSVDLDVQAEEKIIELAHQANKLEQLQFNGYVNENGQRNDSEKNRICLPENKVNCKTLKKDLSAKKITMNGCKDDTDGIVSLITPIPIIERSIHNALKIENADDLLLLPSIKYVPTMATNFSGIFTKNLLETSSASSSSSSSSCDNSATNTITAAQIATTTGITRSNHKKGTSSDILKTNPGHNILRKHEYILPAVSVLCNADNLESATKVTEFFNHTTNNKKKRKMAKKEKVYKEMIASEIDSKTSDNTEISNENENELNTPKKSHNIVIMDAGRFASLENINDFNSDSDEENGVETKSKKAIEKTIKKIEQNLCEILFSPIEKSTKRNLIKELNVQASQEIIDTAKGSESLFNRNEMKESIVNKSNIKPIQESTNELIGSKKIKKVQIKMKRLDKSKYRVSNGDKSKDIPLKSTKVHEPLVAKSGEIIESKSTTENILEEQIITNVLQTSNIRTFIDDKWKIALHSENNGKTSETTEAANGNKDKDIAVKSPKVYESIMGKSSEIVENESTTKNIFEERSTHNVGVFIDDVRKTKFLSENKGITSEATEAVNAINFSTFTIPGIQIEIDEMKTVNELINHSLSPLENYDFNINQSMEEADVSIHLLDTLLLNDEGSINTNNKTNDNNDYIVKNTTPTKTTNDMCQDEVFKQIDIKLHELFQSPQYKITTMQNQQHQAQQQKLEEELKQKQCVDDRVKYKLPISLESPMDECVNSNQENDQSTINVAVNNYLSNDQVEANLSTSSSSSSSLTNTNGKEIKYMSMGSSEYRFEKVSKNVINLYISRKRNRKT